MRIRRRNTRFTSHVPATRRRPTVCFQPAIRCLQQIGQAGSRAWRGTGSFRANPFSLASSSWAWDLPMLRSARTETDPMLNIARPALDPFTHAPIRIGVMGAAGGELPAHLAELARELGAAIASQGCCLLTGACPGLPHEAVRGAKAAGGHVVGISPAVSLREHVEVFGSPYREYDVMIYTGLGLMGRELVNIHSSDIIVVIGGRSGTLGEFAIAYEQGKLIGVLQNSGGITTALPALERNLGKNTGAEVLYADDPARPPTFSTAIAPRPAGARAGRSRARPARCRHRDAEGVAVDSDTDVLTSVAGPQRRVVADDSG